MKRIAVISGDGVGPEVTAESEKVLRAIAERDSNVLLSFEHLAWGTEHYLETGTMMPEDGIEVLKQFDAILFGAVGSARVKDHITLRQLLFRIRYNLDHYVNLRPVKLLPGISSPLSHATPADIDMIFVREGTEGEYAGVGDRMYPGSSREVALQTAVFSRYGTERVIRWAFELAHQQGRTITSVSKGNALQYSGVLWDEIFHEVAADFPEVKYYELLVDAAAMFMVREPRRFQVVVASNLYADILTDLGAAIMGGMGLAPSANLNPAGLYPSMFEPIHGSAPDLEGKSEANPVGSIWSASMLLDQINHMDWARILRRAIELSVLDTRSRTPDIGGTASTGKVGDAIVELLDQSREQVGSV
jgi:tartrate dehydrogenase/decarboxylase / D-malate dehydrogenase